MLFNSEEFLSTHQEHGRRINLHPEHLTNERQIFRVLFVAYGSHSQIVL
jgi:hypothetical protein